MADKRRPYAAIVLAGGEGRRLGGVDKADLVVGGRRLLDRALEAVGSATCRILVGPVRTGHRPSEIVQVREDPPGGGPVAAIGAGLGHVREPLVVVLACDMPFVTAHVIGELLDSLPPAHPTHGGDGVRSQASADGVLLVDGSGLRQPLCAVYRTEPLRRALAVLPHIRGASVRALTASLVLAEVPATSTTALDCDTWESVAACQQQMEEQ